MQIRLTVNGEPRALEVDVRASLLDVLREGLASDRVEQFHGIVNGTSNYILTAMAAGGRAFADVLAEAQRLGYAEADPTLDVGGGDAAHKLAILCMLCFGATVDADAIYTEGIDTLEAMRDLGNTVVVVEHDEETIRSADRVVDLGPGAGVHGGEVVGEG